MPSARANVSAQFDAVVARLGRPADRILFLDDNYARRLGLKGVIIQEVVAQAARDAGFQGLKRGAYGIELGDIIVAVDGDSVEDYDDLYNALDQHKPGDRVVVKVQRGEKLIELKTELIVSGRSPV